MEWSQSGNVDVYVLLASSAWDSGMAESDRISSPSGNVSIAVNERCSFMACWMPFQAKKAPTPNRAQRWRSEMAIGGNKKGEVTCCSLIENAAGLCEDIRRSYGR